MKGTVGFEPTPYPGVGSRRTGSPRCYMMGVPIEKVGAEHLRSTGGCSAPLLSKQRSVRWQRRRLGFAWASGVPTRRVLPLQGRSPLRPPGGGLGVSGDDEARNAQGWKQSREKRTLWCSRQGARDRWPSWSCPRVPPLSHRAFFLPILWDGGGPSQSFTSSILHSGFVLAAQFPCLFLFVDFLWKRIRLSRGL